MILKNYENPINFLNYNRAAAWQSWLTRPSFILKIRVQISAQTENIFLFCLCQI
jgi:hypothetical protein